MALQVVTDAKNDKTEKNDQKYVHNKKTRDGTCVLFCVPPSFVLINNQCNLSRVLYGANGPLNESNKELRMKQWCLYLHSSFPFFQDYAIKAEIIGSYTIYLRRTKIKWNVQLAWQETDNVDTGRGW